MKKLNNNRRVKRKNHANLAMVSVPRPSNPSDVIVRMRLGFTSGIGASGSANTIQLDNPVAIVPGWSARSVDWMTYRVVALMCVVSPADAYSATQGLVNGNRQYASSLVTAANALSYVAPTSANQILEYPGADIRPFNMTNPASRRKFHWHTKDLNALVFGPTNTGPPASYVGVVLAMLTSPIAGASWEVSGWLDIEFRGLSPV